MRSNYANCLPITLKHEGGYSNHKADPGGKTYRGVTQGTYDAWRKSNYLKPRPVINMTQVEMEAIYKHNYWDAVAGDRLAMGVDLATFDASVNSGPARGKKWLLSSIGGTDKNTVQKICSRRLSFVRGLRTWKVFGKGWSRRIADIEARGVKMTMHGMPPKSVESEMRAEAEKAKDKAKDNADGAKGAGGGGAVAGGTEVLVNGGHDPLVTAVIVGLVIVAAIAVTVLIIKRRQNKERAAAYKAVAAEV